MTGVQTCALPISVLFVYLGVQAANLDQVITLLTSFVIVFVDWAYSKYAKPLPTN